MTADPQDFLKSIPQTVTLKTTAGDVTLPHPAKIPFKVIRKANAMPPEEQFIYLFENCADEAALAVLDQLPMAEILILQGIWQQGADLGESSSSES